MDSGKLDRWARVRLVGAAGLVVVAAPIWASWLSPLASKQVAAEAKAPRAGLALVRGNMAGLVVRKRPRAGRRR